MDLAISCHLVSLIPLKRKQTFCKIIYFHNHYPLHDKKRRRICPYLFKWYENYLQIPEEIYSKKHYCRKHYFRKYYMDEQFVLITPMYTKRNEFSEKKFTLNILLIWSISDFPGNKGFIVNSSAKTHPTLHMSIGQLYSWKKKFNFKILY